MTDDRAPDFTCTGCGNRTPDDDTGCLTCDTCETCTPGAGICFDCRDARREDAADRTIRYAIENEVPC